MRKIVFIVIYLCFSIGLLKAQDEKFKALFMYNFTKYLEWPEENIKGDFVIGVFGSSPIIQELMVIAEKKTVSNHPIAVKKIIELEEISKCHIVYVPENKSSRIEEIAQKCSAKGILLITEKEGFAKNFAGINYVKVDGKQNFEINKKNIEGKGIKVNSTLVTLGIEIK
ncbi:MAG: YfiR family protein [Bacteroidales bacterium]|nr:YfiR family protein [Bacteroidales bacterium]